MTLSDQMVEAAAIARHEHCRRRTPLVVSIGWYDLDPEDQACMLAEAHASLTAALALAEAEGAVLCVVPGAAGNGSVTLTHWQQGYNICRDDFLRRSVRIAP